MEASDIPGLMTVAAAEAAEVEAHMTAKAVEEAQEMERLLKAKTLIMGECSDEDPPPASATFEAEKDDKTNTEEKKNSLS